MDLATSKKLQNKLDLLVVQLAEMIKADIYHNTIVSTVDDWFEGNDSIVALNKKIKVNVNKSWGYIEHKVKSHLLEFEEYSINIIKNNISIGSTKLDVKEISSSVSQSISLVVGTIGTSIVVMIAGGTGTALIATGPIGLIIGAIIGIFAFIKSKDAINKGINNYIADKKFPKFIKKTVKGKVFTQLKLNEAKFEQDIYDSLKQHLIPVYKAISKVE